MTKVVKNIQETFSERGLLGGAKVLLQKSLNLVNPPLDVSEEYIDWLYNSNAGILVRGNLYCFDLALRSLPSAAPIVEIGSFCGLSTNVITYYKEKHGIRNPLITCDKWEFEGVKPGDMVGASNISHAEYREFARSTYIRNIQLFSRYDLPYTIEVFSDEFFECWHNKEEVKDVFGRSLRLGGPISFCYIDGNHSYPYVQRDFTNCDRFLEPDGLILFDDSADTWGWVGVRRVVAEVKKSGKYELVVKNPNYLFRKK